MENTIHALQGLGIAAGLGLLVGLQREYSDNPTAGIRTFPLITLLGAIGGLLTPELGGWLIGAGMLSLALVVLGIHVLKVKTDPHDLGITTEVAILLMFAVGAMTTLGQTTAAVAVGGAVMVLLHSKESLHRLVDRMGAKDLKAITQLVLISLVILPILPNRTYGPFDVLNPRQIWWMAVLIVGISLGAYVAYKIVGARGGSLVQAFLGGLISSTATTVAAARQSKGSDESPWLAATIIILAAAVSIARIIGLTVVFVPSHWRTLLLPLSLVFGVWAVLGVAAWLKSRKYEARLPDHDNPAELKTALVFAGLYAVILFAVAAAKHYLGNKGLFIVAGVSGTTDMDAITISTARIAEQGQVAAKVAWQVIVIALMSNSVFKLGSVVLLGSRQLAVIVGVIFAIGLAASGIILATL